jgi:hypothetical protein
VSTQISQIKSLQNEIINLNSLFFFLESEYEEGNMTRDEMNKRQKQIDIEQNYAQARFNNLIHHHGYQ